MSVIGLAAYSFVVAALLAAGAWLLERALLSLRLPARGAWFAALVLSIGLPLVSMIAEPGARELAGPSAGVQTPTSPLEPTPMPTEPAGDDGFRLSAAFDPLIAVSGWASRVLASGAGAVPRDGVVEAWSLAGWITASLLVGLWLAASTWRLRRRAKRWPVETVLGYTVKVAPDLGPATIGALDPRIVLPRWAHELPRHELELILRHESEHARVRDTLLLASGVAATVLIPWNPLIWWQFRRLRDAVEVDCDRRVIQEGVQPGSYGHLLVSIATRGRPLSSATPTIAGSPSLLERRLIIMKGMRDRTSLPRALAAMAVGLLLALVACTTDMPVAADAELAGGPAMTPDGVVAPQTTNEPLTVDVDQDGTVRVDGVVQPIDGIAAAAATLEDSGGGVSLLPHPSAPYGVVSDVVEQLGEAGLLPIVLSVVEFNAEQAPPEVLTAREEPVGPEPEASPWRLLFFHVEDDGSVRVRRADDEQEQRIVARQAESIVGHALSLEPDLIGVVRAVPEAPYEAVMTVVEGIERAGLTRFSLQVVE